MALEKGNLRNYTEEQLYDEITKVNSYSLSLPLPLFSCGMKVRVSVLIQNELKIIYLGLMSQNCVVFFFVHLWVRQCRILGFWCIVLRVVFLMLLPAIADCVHMNIFLVLCLIGWRFEWDITDEDLPSFFGGP